jgi:hypothetical protein
MVCWGFGGHPHNEPSGEFKVKEEDDLRVALVEHRVESDGRNVGVVEKRTE